MALAPTVAAPVTPVPVPVRPFQGLADSGDITQIYLNGTSALDKVVVKRDLTGLSSGGGGGSTIDTSIFAVKTDTNTKLEDSTALALKANKADTNTKAENTAALALKEDKSKKGVASGYAPLDVNLKVPRANLPLSSATPHHIFATQAAMLAYSGGKPIKIGEYVLVHSDPVADNNGEYIALQNAPGTDLDHFENLGTHVHLHRHTADDIDGVIKSDGSINMEAAYTPTAATSVPTKAYVDGKVNYIEETINTNGYTPAAITGDPGETGILLLTQDATGNYTVAFPGSYKVVGGTPVVDLTANSKNVFRYTMIGTVVMIEFLHSYS